MGKLVKYCSECEEGFAERFGFCPNCGGALEAFELNPVAKSDEAMERRSDDAAVFEESNETVGETVSTASVIPAAVPETMDFSGDDILELDAVDTREEMPETETFVPAATAAASNAFHSEGFSNNATDNFANNFQLSDDNYHVTVVSEKASSWFQPFLLGLMAFAFVAAIASYVIAIWIHGYKIPEIDGLGETLYSNLSDEIPPEMEEIKKRNDKAGGGGGGGGNENENDASKGRIPTHSDVPNKIMIVPRFDSDLKIRNTVNSKVEREDDGQQVGNPNGTDGVSSGKGKGGGIGNGLGTGIGNGIGGGVGNGRGNGTGDGIGDGIGNGIGDGQGTNRDDDEPKIKPKEVKPAGETKGLSITSKPRPNYTDAARQNNVQGTVTLRVTFNANGTIGSVTPVNSLPYGLTEQAISAAKRMTFQPAMRNGQPYAVTKQVAFTFTIY